MRPSRLGLFFAAGIFMSPTLAQEQSQNMAPAILPQSSVSVAKEIARIDDERRNAYLQNDAAALDRILADDVTAIAGIGVEDNKASILADIRSHDLIYKKLTYDHRKIRIFGETAVVTAHAEVVANYKDKDLSGQLLGTRVYAKQQGGWKLVATQSTRIPQPVSASEFSSGSAESGSMRDRFIGAWELVSTEERLVDGTKRPYRETGPHGKGYLMYSADGHMCAALMNPDRPPWKDFNNPSESEKTSAIDGFFGYCGRYEIDEVNRVMLHYPEVASSPNYVGTKQPRPYSFDKDLLTFSVKDTGIEGVESHSITWRKAAPPSKSKEQSPMFESTANAEAELRAVMAERLKASIAGDAKKISDLMTDDYIQTDVAGYVQDKTTWFNEYFNPLAALIKAGTFRWDTFEEKDVQIRAHGDTAIVLGALLLTSSGAAPDRERHTWVVDPGAHRSSALRFTRVYVKRNGKWLLAALHNQLPPPPPTNN